MRVRTRLLAALAALTLAGADVAAAQTPSGDALLNRLRTRYSQARSLRAEFTQTTRSAYGGTESFRGTLLTQGRAYRVDGTGPQFVTDGRTTWLYDPSRNQVVVNRFVEDETTFSPTTFLSRYSARYRVARVVPSGSGAARTYTLTLAPRSASETFDRVVLVMRDRDNAVTRLDLRDLNGTQIRYDLRNVQFNPAVPTGAFTFRAPRGAEVVDLRS